MKVSFFHFEKYISWLEIAWENNFQKYWHKRGFDFLYESLNRIGKRIHMHTEDTFIDTIGLLNPTDQITDII